MPRFIAHDVTITVANGTYAELPEIANKHLVNSSPAEFQITGNTTTPTNVVVNGLLVKDCSGYLCPKFDGFEFSGGVYDNGGGNEAVVMVLGVERASFDRTTIDGTGFGPADSGISGICVCY